MIGEVIKGMSYVNETDITGSLEHKLKSPDKDNILIAGSIVEGGDWIVMKVSFASNKSFFTRVGRLLRNINRQAMPSEVALQKLMIGLSILFANVIFVCFGKKIPLRKSRRAILPRLNTNIILSILTFLMSITIVRPTALLGASWSYQYSIGILNWLDLNGGIKTVLGILLLDLSFYYWHRLTHFSPFV